MAAKRLIDESGNRLGSKRMRTKPSFAAVIGEVVVVNSLQNLFSALEPMLRRVVNEEVERGLQRGRLTINRSLPFPIQAQELSSTLQLSFTKKVHLPIFTASKIEFQDNNQLQVILVNVGADQRPVPTILPYPIKIEIVVVDGDFPLADRDDRNWTSEQFNKKIIQERTGKRPLITGDVLVNLRDGCASITELTFTDNSSWIRSRKFRIGARVVDEGSGCNGLRIREAITEPFIVKDHRGELYKKHHPPSLNDDVWRLEKIGKDGAFHKKLLAEMVHTVQDFLKLWIVEPAKLRAILGAGMSDKMFEVTIKHAKACVLGSKHYMLQGPWYTIYLNPICQVVGVVLDGKAYPTHDLTAVQRVHVESLVKEAYTNWNSLEPVDKPSIGMVSSMMQYVDHSHNMRRSNESIRLLRDDYESVEVRQGNWPEYSIYPDHENPSNISDSSSDGDSSIFFRGAL